MGTPQTHLHLLLGVQLLPEGLHAGRKAQEALNALPEELQLVRGKESACSSEVEMRV